MSNHRKTYNPVSSKNDPCAPMPEKTYETPPNLYMGIQESGLEQFRPAEAWAKGTLWPALYGPYDSPTLPVKNKKGES